MTRFLACVCLGVTLVGAQNLLASGIVYSFDNVFSGQSTPPAGPGPWASATLLDLSPGTVSLTISNSGLSSGEFISGLYLNLNPADNVNNLSFTQTGSSGSFTVPTISTGEDGFKADGDGKYDILFSFSTPNGTTFTVNDSITYKITGIANLTSSDFSFLSSPAGGSGPFYAAAHIQGTPPNNGSSCWVEPSPGPVVVPEPAPMILLGFGAGLWLCFRSHQRRSKALSPQA
ncbi:MAG TPA: hypothetical protein VN578_24255 [Candidatus Binatia bacterium]|nr:hypothetical protein [Candidatus Binatia bacterium]